MVILAFCENLAEIGCPKDVEPNMWFRSLKPEEMFEVSSKLLKIMDEFNYEGRR